MSKHCLNIRGILVDLNMRGNHEIGLRLQFLVALFFLSVWTFDDFAWLEEFEISRRMRASMRISLEGTSVGLSAILQEDMEAEIKSEWYNIFSWWKATELVHRFKPLYNPVLLSNELGKHN